jgi:hypothetical protein
MSSVFTPPGTNAASSEQARQWNAAADSGQLLNDLFPSLQEEANYAGSLEPQREEDINRAMMLASPGNAQARTSIYNAQVEANANQAAQQAALQDQAQGLSPGYQAGANSAIQNAAAAAENQYAQQQLSPQQALANAQTELGAVSNGMAMPELPALSGLTGLVYGQPKVQVGQGLGGFLGGLAGDYLGGDFGALGGSGGGGGSTSGGGNWGTGPTFNSQTEDSDVPWYGGTAPAAGGTYGADANGDTIGFGAGLG